MILNQFAEFGNHLGHYLVTGRALEAVVEAQRTTQPNITAAAFVSATGSAGTIAAGDWLKDRYGTKIVAVEALECPTLLENGFGEHNIQGIGDKHVPLIHNVMNTDLVVAISDVATDQLLSVFNTDAGRTYLADRRGVPAAIIAELGSFGISSICNILAAIKTAKVLDLGPDEVVVTVATDGAAMYLSEQAKITARDFPGGFDAVAAAETFGRHVLGAGEDHLLELTRADRDRIFNLGYFTWVEQQGMPIDEFEARRSQDWWRDLRSLIPAWDEMIDEFNASDRRQRRLMTAQPEIAPAADRRPPAADLVRLLGLRRATGRRSAGPADLPAGQGRRRHRPRPGPAPRSGRGARSRAATTRTRSSATGACSTPGTPPSRPVGATPTTSRWSSASTRPSPRSTATASGSRRSPGTVRSRAALGLADGGRRLGQGRDRQRVRLAQGPPPHGHAARARGRRAVERPARAPLAIASCGNAALAAAVVARAADRRLRVFIPPDADPAVVARLRRSAPS